jgi:hypothetical protein
MKKSYKAEETATKMDGQHPEGMNGPHKSVIESRRKADPLKDEIGEALKNIFKLQLEILQLGDPLQYVHQLHATAFWVTRLMADDFKPTEVYKINNTYSLLLSVLDLPKKHQRKKRNARPVAHPTPAATRARPARARREARRRP